MTAIYGLFDPRTRECRYVGLTGRRVEVRFRAHLRDAKHGSEGARCDWIRELLAIEKLPTVKILEESPAASAGLQEQWWITYWCSLGHRLTNLARGGYGFTGKHRPETIERMRAAHLARPPKSAEHRERLRQALLGHPVSDATRLKIGERGQGRIWTEASKVKKAATIRAKREALRRHRISEAIRGSQWSATRREAYALKVVAVREAMLHSAAAASARACGNGHPQIPENLLADGSCRECGRRRAAAYRARIAGGLLP